VNSLRFLSSLPDASGKSLLRKLGFGYMLSPMVACTSRIIMQAIPARVIQSVESVDSAELIIVRMFLGMAEVSSGSLSRVWIVLN